MAVGLRILEALKHPFGAFTGKEGIPIQSDVTTIPKHLVFSDFKKWMFNSKINITDKNKLLVINNAGDNVEVKNSNDLINVDVNPAVEDMPLAIVEINIDNITNLSKLKIFNNWITWLVSRVIKQGGVVGDIPIKSNSANYNWSWTDISVNAVIMQKLVNSLTNTANSWVSGVNGFQSQSTINLTGTGLSATTVQGAFVEINTKVNNNTPAGTLLFTDVNITLIGWTEVTSAYIGRSPIGTDNNSNTGNIVGSNFIFTPNLPSIVSLPSSNTGNESSHTHSSGSDPNGYVIPQHQHEVGTVIGGGGGGDDILRQNDGGAYNNNEQTQSIKDYSTWINKAVLGTSGTGSPHNHTLPSYVYTNLTHTAYTPLSFKVRIYRKN